MADYAKLFLDRRLDAKLEHHHEYIVSRLRNMKFDNPVGFKDYSEHYGVDVGDGLKRVKMVDPGKTKVVKKKTVKKDKKS